MVHSSRVPDQPSRYENLIGGRWSAGTGGEIVRESPAHGVPVSILPCDTSADVDSAVQAARRRFSGSGWADRPAGERADVLRRAASLILE